MLEMNYGVSFSGAHCLLRSVLDFIERYRNSVMRGAGEFDGWFENQRGGGLRYKDCPG